jgi:hypothetical protein
MNVETVAQSRMDRRDHVWVRLVHEPDVTVESRIEDLVDVVSLVMGSEGLSSDRSAP